MNFAAADLEALPVEQEVVCANGEGVLGLGWESGEAAFAIPAMRPITIINQDALSNFIKTALIVREIRDGRN